MRTLQSILAEHAFFSGLNKRHLELLVGCASNTRFDAGHMIFHEGEEANQFYLVRHGKVALEIGVPGRPPVSVQTLGEGDVLGWSWLLPPYHWRFSARAIEPTRAISLDGRCLRNKCEEDHDLGYELLKQFGHIVVQRLDATRLQLLDVYGRGS